MGSAGVVGVLEEVRALDVVSMLGMVMGVLDLEVHALAGVLDVDVAALDMADALDLEVRALDVVSTLGW